MFSRLFSPFSTRPWREREGEREFFAKLKETEGAKNF
jgi:hypothetical protein